MGAAVRTNTRMVVVAKPGALKQAIDAAGIPSAYRLWRIIEEKFGTPKRATVSALFTDPDYAIGVESAMNISTALGRPIEQLFEHPDGAELRAEGLPR